jgi:hypothetical protein
MRVVAMALPVAAAASPPPVVIPELASVPVLLDGRIEPEEWRGAIGVEAAPGLRLLLKQSAGHVYLAVVTPGSSSQPMDLMLVADDERIHQLHASQQIGEREPTAAEPEPAWRWGNHVGWLASEMKRDPQRSDAASLAEQLYPADGTEYQIRRGRFRGGTRRVRLTVDAMPGAPQSFVYPADSRAEDRSSWARWQLDPVP